MLCVNGYTKPYVEVCRSKFAEQASAYQALVEAAGHGQAAKEPKVKTALSAFERHLFNNMVLALDSHFAHRAKASEKKDGNPLNEVRMLSNSIMSNDNVMTADKTIKYNPEKSVLKLRIGDMISLSAADFTRLAAAYLAEIEAKYV